ncbi:MAG TPA: ACP synthase, partial [Archangium sp.]|nr:ACP synthase [Archangium sp.]
LPDSVEFTGSGHERLVLVLSEEPLEVEEVRAAAQRAWERVGRDVVNLRRLGVGGDETHWLLRKP